MSKEPAGHEVDTMRADEPVNRLMTPDVLTVEASAPAGRALEIFSGYPIHHLPVVDQDSVVGVLGMADLLRLRSMIPVSVTNPVEWLNARMQAGALVRTPAITVPERETVQRACEIMAEHAIHSLPVVDSNGRLVGILTSNDVLGAVFERREPQPGLDEQPVGDPASLTPSEYANALAAARSAVESTRGGRAIATALLFADRRIRQLEHMVSRAHRA